MSAPVQDPFVNGSMAICGSLISITATCRGSGGDVMGQIPNITCYQTAQRSNISYCNNSMQCPSESDVLNFSAIVKNNNTVYQNASGIINGSHISYTNVSTVTGPQASKGTSVRSISARMYAL